MENEETKKGVLLSGLRDFFTETFKFALIALIIVIPFRIFIAQPFIVNGSSMSPTFESGEYLIVDQISIRFKDLKRGDVIIFKYPNDTKKFFIKRIIGLPKDIIEIEGGKIQIINEENKKFYFKEEYIKYNKDENFSVKLESDEYFVLGDNRAKSSDSRTWGPLQQDLIVGKPIIRLLPFNKINILPGKFNIEKII